LSLSVLPRAEEAAFGPMDTLWSGPLTLQQGEARDEAIEVLTSSLTGVCVDLAGQPVGGVMVRAEGQLAGAAGDGKNQRPIRTTNSTTTTNAQGEFTFARVAAGTWRLSVRTGRGAARGELAGIAVVGGAPVAGLRLVAQPTIEVAGRVDMAPLGQAKRNWAWVQANRVDEQGKPDAADGGRTGFGVDKDDGTFRTNDLLPGRYDLTMYAGGEGKSEQYDLGMLRVPAGGARNVVLVPTRIPPNTPR